MTKIINLFGGPGSGKSTTAALLFGRMKLLGYNVELVTEFAKQMVWQERQKILTHQQSYVHAKQLHYLDSVVGKVDYIVTDSPTLLSAIYAPTPYTEGFDDFVINTFIQYDNLNFFIERLKQYNPVGRNQTQSEAIEIDNKIKTFLYENNIFHYGIGGDENAPLKILEIIKNA